MQPCSLCANDHPTMRDTNDFLMRSTLRSEKASRVLHDRMAIYSKLNSPLKEVKLRRVQVCEEMRRISARMEIDISIVTSYTNLPSLPNISEVISDAQQRILFDTIEIADLQEQKDKLHIEGMVREREMNAFMDSYMSYGHTTASISTRV